MDESTRNVIIIGSGPAGYTAAIYASRAQLSPLLISGKEPGGQLMQTTEVENWPGEDEGIMGPELMANMRKQAARFGTEFVEDMVTNVDFCVRPFKLETATGKTFTSHAVIIATGASARWLGAPGEDKLKGRGVSACATCDGFFFKGKKVIVVGGGDSAMEEATFLTRFASEVVVLVRSEVLRASKIMQERAMNNPKISFMWNTDVLEVIGEEKLDSVKVKNSKTGEEAILQADGLFAAIGHKPNTEVFKDVITLDERVYIKHEPDSTKTNIEGIFACGDVIDPWYRQAVTASGSGCMAALEAERWLAAQGHH